MSFILTLEASIAIAGVLLVLFRSAPGRVDRTGGSTFTWVDAIAVAAIAVLTVTVYAPIANSYFLSDDFILLGHARSPWGWRALFATRGGDGFFRPAGYIANMITVKWAGSDPAAWHWIGIVLHLANGILVFALAISLRFSRLAAWLAAMNFSLHGTRPEVVVWMAGRYDLLATLFFLIATVAFVRSWEAPGARAVVLEALALFAMIVALLSKESAYAYPLIALLLVLCFPATRNRWPVVILFWVAASVLFIYRWMLLGGIGGYQGLAPLSSVKALAVRVWAILLFPVNWTLPISLALLVLTVFYLLALAKLFSVRAERHRLGFALGFIFLAALPALSQLLIGLDLEKSRVLYLPSIGFCLLLASLADPLTMRERTVVATGILLFHGVVLWHNLGAWRAASRAVESACVTVAACTQNRGDRVLVSGLPRMLNGVYTFANGFPECVALQGGAGQVELQASGSGNYTCKFRWDAAAKTLTKE